MIATDAAITKLHVHRGTVWALKGAGLAECTGMSVADFMQSNRLAGAESIRLVGDCANASLIVDLWRLKQSGQLGSVQLASPLVCPTKADRSNPEAVLYYMRRFARPRSLGGFHEMDHNDCHTYRLVAAVRNQPVPALTSAVRECLHQHPAWYPLQFVSRLDHWAVAQLLATIIDPRWYIDPSRPDRSAKLVAFLGLNPKTQAGVTDPSKPRWEGHNRCDLVRKCWQNPEALNDVKDTYQRCAPHVVVEATRFGLSPHDFVWRVWGNRAGYSVAKDPPTPSAVAADLRASQKFVTFLRLTWLDRLTEAVVKGGMSLFRARDFFRFPEEAKAFELWMSQEPRRR